ncbi:MAG: response regulator [Synergistaceae bacterium]|jgi:putative two-component system response regulator|nr:response regulator [Synergistaceae bacterium]
MQGSEGPDRRFAEQTAPLTLNRRRKIIRQILVVDDNITSLRQIGYQLAGCYEFSLVTSGAAALSFCETEKPDLILLDVEMPDMDGFETIVGLRGLPGVEEIPVIFLTGNMDEATELRAFESGARDFITKPVDKKILQHRIELHLQLYEYQTDLENTLKELESNIVASFADLVECKDDNTGGHVLRTSRYVEMLGRELIENGHCADELTEAELELMVQAAPFHDIGKIGISDVLLLKPKGLTDEEYAEVKNHTLIGGRVLENIHRRAPAQRYLGYARLMAEGHHERYDGSGYPYGLKGAEIPICCRLMAVANVYDACMTDRRYRPALSRNEAARIIENGSGTEFDPLVVNAFRSLESRIDEPSGRRRRPTVYRGGGLRSKKNEILIVDDNIASLKQIGASLAGSYEYSLATSGAQALASCLGNPPDLILLDVEMPEMDGFETIARLKKSPALSHIPVIFLTGVRNVAAEVEGFGSGAVDFIKKPVLRDALLHRIRLHLDIASCRSYLTDSVREISSCLTASFAELIECRDEGTGEHVQRTSRYVELLGRELLSRGLFANELSGPALDLMVSAAPLHDIGKISVSDRILLKAGRLDDEEFAEMKLHAPIGAEILERMCERTPTQTYLRYAVMIAASHHERYDGKGYPNGLAGGNIPLCGRIMAVADVYDALVDDRVYRRGMSHAEAFRIITDGTGTQFDPRVVEAFESCHLKFSELAKIPNRQ